MRLSLATKFCFSTGGVIALAVLSSLTALLLSWHVGSVMHRTVTENLTSVRAAEELNNAVLAQRGFVSSYLLDEGNREWLVELEERKHVFHQWLQRAKDAAHTPEEKECLKKLQEVYQEYDAKRDEVVALYDRGDGAQAKKLLVGDVNALAGCAYELCGKFIMANERYVTATTEDARLQIQWMTGAMGGCVLLTIGLGGVLLWLFFYGVVFPLRHMAADARGFVGEPPPGSPSLPSDELRAVGVYLRGLMSDVADTRTTLERSQSQLRDAEKLASVGKLAASVAHEIRNPLTAIKMWLFSIQKEVGGKEALDRKFETVSEEIRRLEGIVRHFLEFSRMPELKLAVESVPAILDKTLRLVEPRNADHRIKLVREDAADLPPVRADGEQIRQVMLNLLNNASEAAGNGGRIRVVTTAEGDTDGRKMVVVRVSDNGPGMPEDVASRIFEPFFTTKDEGMGLGLPIAARIMARHEGRLILESSNPQGTTFAVYLPAAQREYR